MITNKVKVRSLKFKLILFMLIVLFISILGLSLISVRISSSNIKNITIDNMNQEVSTISDTIYYRIKSEINKLSLYQKDDDLIKLLGYSKENIKKGDKKFLELQNSVNKEFLEQKETSKSILNMYVMNKEGIIYSSVFPDAAGTDCSERNYFKRAINNEDMIVDDVVSSDRLKANVNMISAPIYNGKDVIGVITAVMSTDIYSEIIDKNSKGMAVEFITDNNGNLVYHPNKQTIGLPLDNEKLNEIASGKGEESGIIEYKVNNDEYIGIYSTIKEIGWKVFYENNVKEIYQPINKLKLLLVVITIAILILSAIIVYLISNSITLPIIEMTEQVKKIAEGDLTIKVKESDINSEILNLSKGFNKMVDNISGLIGDASETIKRVEEASNNLSAISEEVSASNLEINKQVALISDNTIDQVDNASKSSNKIISLGRSIEKLDGKNIIMKKQGEVVSESLIVSTSKFKYLVESNIKSKESFDDVKKTVEEMIVQIGNISNIIAVIDNISKQTSLLSLNASIESARAGEAGKGFAVVAAEIRGLANEVQVATTNISGIIKSIQDIVNKTKGTLSESVRLNNEQVNAYNSVSETISIMENSLNDMLNITNEISNEIQIVNRQKEENLKSIKGVVAKSEEISSVIQEVNQSIEEQNTAFENVTISSEELIDLSQVMKESIDKFKI